MGVHDGLSPVLSPFNCLRFPRLVPLFPQINLQNDIWYAYTNRRPSIDGQRTWMGWNEVPYNARPFNNGQGSESYATSRIDTFVILIPLYNADENDVLNNVVCTKAGDYCMTALGNAIQQQVVNGDLVPGRSNMHSWPSSSVVFARQVQRTDGIPPPAIAGPHNFRMVFECQEWTIPAPDGTMFYTKKYDDDHCFVCMNLEDC